MKQLKLYFSCFIPCVPGHNRHFLYEDTRSTILQERVASISFSKISSQHVKPNPELHICFSLFCFVLSHFPQACRYQTVNYVCIFRPLTACFLFFWHGCVRVCKCEFANVLRLCFSFWKFLWCACLFIYLCCVQAFSAVKATVDVLCAAQTAIHHSWTSLTAEPLTSSSQHPPFAATGTLLKSHRAQAHLIRLCVYLDRD